MRALHVYVVVYVALVVGVAFTLWRAGMLDRVTPLTTVVVIVGALALAALVSCCEVCSTEFTISKTVEATFPCAGTIW